MVYTFVGSTPILLDFISMIHDLELEIPGIIDRTYRLVCLGWFLTTLATYSIKFSATDLDYRRTCLPLAKMVTFTEHHIAYDYKLQVVRNILKTHYRKRQS